MPTSTKQELPQVWFIRAVTKSIIRRMILDNKQVFVRHGGIYVRVNPCNLQLVNDPVKDYEGETVDNDSNCSKENQNISTDMIFEVDTENVSNEFEEQRVKENKDGQVNDLTDTNSRLELNNESINPTKTTKAFGIALTIKSKVTYEDPDLKKRKRALVLSRTGKASGKNKYCLTIEIWMITK